MICGLVFLLQSNLFVYLYHISTTMDWLLELGYLGLFLGSFLAATVVPFSADALLVGVLVGGLNPWVAIAVATAGNWLGGLTSYGVGRSGQWRWIERFGVKRETLERQKGRIERYGSLVALLVWVPFVGDIFAIALGFYRVRFVPSAIYMLIGKAARFVMWYGLYVLF